MGYLPPWKGQGVWIHHHGRKWSERWLVGNTESMKWHEPSL